MNGHTLFTIWYSGAILVLAVVVFAFLRKYYVEYVNYLKQTRFNPPDFFEDWDGGSLDGPDFLMYGLIHLLLILIWPLSLTIGLLVLLIRFMKRAG